MYFREVRLGYDILFPVPDYSRYALSIYESHDQHDDIQWPKH